MAAGASNLNGPLGTSCSRSSPVYYIGSRRVFPSGVAPGIRFSRGRATYAVLSRRTPGGACTAGGVTLPLLPCADAPFPRDCVGSGGVSSRGRTAVFKTVSEGSSPSSPAYAGRLGRALVHTRPASVQFRAPAASEAYDGNAVSMFEPSQFAAKGSPPKPDAPPAGVPLWARSRCPGSRNEPQKAQLRDAPRC